MRALIAALFILCGANPSFAATMEISLLSTPVPIPGGQGGIGFDDLGFAPGLNKVLVPGGRTGELLLIDPQTHQITAISGFSKKQDYKGGHGEGTTSADEGAGFLFASDRNTNAVNVVDPAKNKVVASAALSGSPDYVRYVDATHEVWATQPGKGQIEVLKFFSSPRPRLVHSAFIFVPGGPEALVIDNARQRAYTHLWKGSTVSIDLKTHAVVAQWPNGCVSSRGIALDPEKNFLLVSCSEGKAVTLDLNNNAQQIGSLNAGSGLDVIGYNKKLAHLYLAGSKSATLVVAGLSPQGALSLLGIGKAAEGSHCATGDPSGNIWVCDPGRGQLLLYKDPFPASR